MSEAEWLAATDPQPMLEALRCRASGRKVRLFACASCRRVWKLLSDKHSRKALTVAERYADAEVSEAKLGFAWGDARRAAQVAHRQERETAEASAMWSVSMLCEADPGRAVAAAELAARCEAFPGEPSLLADARREHLLLIRDIFGNLFRPAPAVDAAWLAWQGGVVRELAWAAYDGRRLPQGTLEPERLAVLADALEEAGCGDAELVGHLRGPGPHVRGCWAVDLILARS